MLIFVRFPQGEILKFWSVLPFLIIQNIASRALEIFLLSFVQPSVPGARYVAA